VTRCRNQPTCTIQALVYRASGHISRMAKSEKHSDGPLRGKRIVGVPCCGDSDGLTYTWQFLLEAPVASPDLLTALQRPIEELGSRGVGPQPVPPQQKSVDLIRQDQLFERHVLRP
jgi:hypothetical protein